MIKWKRCITECRKPEQRGGHGAILWHNKLIVVGGHRYEKEGKFRYFNDTYILDLDTLVWKEVRCGGEILAPRYGHSCELVSSHQNYKRIWVPIWEHPKSHFSTFYNALYYALIFVWKKLHAYFGEAS